LGPLLHQPIIHDLKDTTLSRFSHVWKAGAAS